MRTPSAICAALLLAGALPDRAANADEVPRVRMISVEDATAAATSATAPQVPHATGVGHCSVVGAVQSPGTYTGSGAGILLQTLIEQSGGLTGHASGIVRLLHNGRQQVINLTVSSGADVVPWDSVIVVDSATSGSQSSTGAEPNYCDIACVNLCDRPAVLCLKPQHASLPQLLELLGQAPEVAATVRIVLPAGVAQSGEQSLPSGSVVIFDPNALDQPALGSVLENNPLQDLVPLETAGHERVSAEVVEQLQTLENYLQPDASTLLPGPIPAAAIEPLPAPPVAASTAPPTLSAPDPVAEGVPGATLVRPASAFQLQSPLAGRPPVVEEDFTAEDYERARQKTRAAKASTQANVATDEMVATVTVDANEQWLRFGTSVVAWLLCGLAAYGGFGIWMRQHERRRREAVRDDSPIELSRPVPTIESRSMLSQLIENSAPIREEEATSSCQVFHGRTVGFRYLIRSGPHGLQGPHFAAQRAQSRSPVAAAAGVRARPEPTETRATSRERTVNRVDRGAEGVPVREADRPAGVAVPAGRGVSPLERALRSLMRESAEVRT